jgi:hypothetical protein
MSESDGSTNKFEGVTNDRLERLTAFEEVLIAQGMSREQARSALMANLTRSWREYPCEPERPQFAHITVDWERFYQFRMEQKAAQTTARAEGTMEVGSSLNQKVLAITHGRRTSNMDSVPRKGPAIAVSDRLPIFLERVRKAIDIATSTENSEIRRAIIKYEIDPAWAEVRADLVQQLGLSKRTA